MSDSDYSDFEVGDEPMPAAPSAQLQQAAALQQLQSALQLNQDQQHQQQQHQLNNEPQSIQTITQAASAMAAAMAAQQLLASVAAISGIDLASLTNLAALAGQPTPVNAPEQLMAAAVAAVAAAAFLSQNNLVPEDLSVAQQQQLQLASSHQQQQQGSQPAQHLHQQQLQQHQQQHQAQQHRQAQQVPQVPQQQQQPAGAASLMAGLSISAVPSLLQQHHQQLLAQQQQQNFHLQQQHQNQNQNQGHNQAQNQNQAQQQQHGNSNANHANHLHSAAKHHHALGGHHHHSSIQTQQQLLATKGFNPMAVVLGSGQQTEILTPTHLRKAKLMFFYVRYPNSSTLKECFRDVRFNKNNTAQLVKWFSNFREFYYIQMEKFARESVNDHRITCKEDIVVNYDHELINQLNNHYNKNRHIELPEVFRAVVEETLRHFFDAIHNKRDQEQSWKKAIYKLIARLDQEVPDVFKTDAFNEHLEGPRNIEMGCYSVLKHQEHAHDDVIWTICWVSQNNLITGSLDTTAKVWNLNSKSGEGSLTEDRVIDGFALGVISVDVAPQTSTVAIAAMDSKIRLFDLSKPLDSCELKTIDAGPTDSWKIKFSPDGKHIATGGMNGKVNLYSANLEGETTKTQFDVGKFAYSVDFSPDGKLLAAGNVAGIINVFDLETEKLLTQIGGHALPVRAVAFSPDSKLLLSGSDDNQIKIHYPRHDEQIKTLSGHGSWILDLAFSPNGSHFASGSTDKKVKIWDMTSHECIQTFSHHTNQVTGVRYDPNGSRLASVSEDGSIVIYDHIK